MTAISLAHRVGFAAMVQERAIVVGGEALIDLVPHQAGELRAHAGGGPYNTARTLGRLGQPVHFLGCLSDDGFGARLRAQLSEDGVRLDTVVETPLPTTLALAEVDAAGAATYRFYTEGTSAPALGPEAALAALPERVDFLHVGTLGLVMEPTAMALQAAVEAVAASALVMIDPNCRPTFIPDRDTYRRTLAATLAYAHVVKVSGDDLEYLEPDLPLLESARALLEDGPRVVLVTLGGDGAMIVTAGAERRVPAPKIEVVDTIGAGDAFGGGFLAWWNVRGLGRDDLGDPEAVAEATRFACVVAARTCERPGASPPLLSDVQSEL
jgi:fructokinase